MMYLRELLFATFRAGIPAIIILGSSNNRLTTEFAPMAILSAIFIRSNILLRGQYRHCFRVNIISLRPAQKGGAVTGKQTQE